jgi:hypothetical protein
MTKRRYAPSLYVLRKRLAAWRRYVGPWDARPAIEAIEREIDERIKHETSHNERIAGGGAGVR